MNKSITMERLRELLHYDQQTGIFTRLKRSGGRWGRGAVGEHVGSKHVDGYLTIYIDKTSYKAHRLAWFYMTGERPPQIDHINGQRADNRFSNLRGATDVTNQQNRRAANANNKSGYLGVSLSSGCNPFRAYICVNRKNITLGRFDTAEKAHAAYVVAKRRLHQGCTI